jgi:serine/threonine protein kinase
MGLFVNSKIIPVKGNCNVNEKELSFLFAQQEFSYFADVARRIAEINLASAIIENFEKEASILITLNHPNILKFYGCSIKPPRVGILMEYCDCGDLRGYCQKNRDITIVRISPSFKT